VANALRTREANEIGGKGQQPPVVAMSTSIRRKDDISDVRRQLERERLQTVLLDEVSVAVYAIDLDGKVLTWNAAAERLFGWTADQAIGRRIEELVAAPQASVGRPVRRKMQEGPWEGELLRARKGGETFPAYVRTRLVEDLDDGASVIVVVTVDITERQRNDHELKLAQDHLRAVIDSVGEGMFTLDAEGRVTYVNPMAEGLLGWRKEDLVGRMMHEAVHFQHADGSPFPIEDCPIRHAARDGEMKRIAEDVFVCSDGTSLPVAYTASPFATDAGVEGCVIVFRDITQRTAEKRRMELEIGKLGWLKRVREALDNAHFVLHAQPIIDLADGTVVQRELLIRMQNPNGTGGVIAPGSFLPVAEEFGLVPEIDRWVIDQAADVAARGLPVELNVSAASLGDKGLISHIAQAFDRTGADPANVIFELTETALLSAQAEGLAFVEWLHAFGCGFALDDFGTGYGGFTYLKQLPIDLLKIDIEFVRDVIVNPASRNVVEAIVGLAERFDLRTVAEGVEDAATMNLLREMGVNRAQGYHIGRPAPLDVPDDQALPASPEGLRAR
jgi:PAS domain S-box-containing protein